MDKKEVPAMKGFMWLVLLILISATHVQADWADNFKVLAESEGVEIAVIESLKDGVDPDDMVALGGQASVSGIEPTGLIKALYCSGVPGSKILSAANKAGVPEFVVVAGQRKSFGGCGPAFARSFNPTDNARTRASSWKPSGTDDGELPIVPPVPPGGGGGDPASPYRF